MSNALDNAGHNTEQAQASQSPSSQSLPCSPPDLLPDLSSTSPPDLTAIASMLTETAQALLDFSKASETDPPDDQEAPAAAEPESSQQCVQFCYDLREVNVSSEVCKITKAFEKDYECGDFTDEIRCFRIPHAIVELEYNLCCHYKQENLTYLVDIVRDDLLSITMLMKHFDDSVNISGHELQLIAKSLSRPLQLLREVCTQLADYTLVHKTRIPVQ